MDRRLLEDAHTFELALAVKGDLLADYAVGELSASEAAVVRGWLVSSAEVRARFRLVKDTLLFARRG